MAKLRYEFALMGAGRGQRGGQIEAASAPLASGVLDAGTAATPAASQPVVPAAGGDVFARLTALDAAAYAALSSAPDPTTEPRITLKAGETRVVRVFAGQKLAALAGADVPVAATGALALTAGAARIGYVGSRATVRQAVDATRTRPANATAYAVHGALGDAAGCVFKFSNFFPEAGATGVLTGLAVVMSGPGIAASHGGTLVGHLYNAAPASPPGADGQPFASLAANAGAALGAVDVSGWTVGGTGSDSIGALGVPRLSVQQIRAAAAARDLYLLLEAGAAFTPLSGAVIGAYASALFD